jgi:putative phosphonate metabolism protein
VRYAFYLTPDENHPLTIAAAKWLGSNPFTDEMTRLEAAGDFDAVELTALTADPRRYGFHGTLKAPFPLATAKTEGQLLAAFESFAEECAPFEIPEMVLGQLGPFFALVPDANCPELQALADETVRRFEPFRAPLSAEDLSRRKPGSLTDVHRSNLLSWGYPYVFESFQFHMTLTGPVPVERQASMRALLEQTFARFTGKPLAVTSLALFTEHARGAPFTVHSLLPLGGTSQRKMA